MRENRASDRRAGSAVSGVLDALRMQVRAIEGHYLDDGRAPPVLPFADPRLNEPLPGGGLSLGALHEFTAAALEAELAPSVTAFAATVLAAHLRVRGGVALWAASQSDCYVPGLRRFGLDPARIVFVDCRKDAEVLAVMEEALHSRAVAAVLGEAGALTLKTGRRLDAAARTSNALALLVRRHVVKPRGVAGEPSGAASTRWRVAAVPSSDVFGGLGPPRWRLDLDYCRNGRTASFIVEALDGADGHTFEAGHGKAGHVRVVAELCDDARAAEAPEAREAARTARPS
ncbi:ImuA family protein [Rhodomicrobium lacus]|uniref:ImuA family protein n=1 Tax=Rhodomicrobium lacus TaxID=2498452 RepID=UPI0013DEDBA6|nr:protein imuA [Rhodomicrobium lacus]